MTKKNKKKKQAQQEAAAKKPTPATTTTVKVVPSTVTPAPLPEEVPLVKIPNSILDNFEFNYWYSFLPARDFLRHMRVNKNFFSKLNTIEMWHMLLVRDHHHAIANLSIASATYPTLQLAKKQYQSMTRFKCHNCKQEFSIFTIQTKEYSNVCQYHKGPYESAGGRADTVERGRWSCCGAYVWYDSDPSPPEPCCVKTVHKFF